MARIDEIKKEITDAFVENESVIEQYKLIAGKTFDEQFSRASIESVLFYSSAYRAWLIEELFNYNLQLMDEKIRNQRVHTLGWYRSTALNFQYGKEFRNDLTEYDNSDLTDEEIEAQRIVKKCSVAKADADKPTLTVKVHKANGKLSGAEMAAFSAYMTDKADPGVNISVVSSDADKLVLYITIRYDVMAMDEFGNRLLDGKKVVDETVVNHLNNLEFNGTFYPSLLEQELMRQTGIRIATIRSAMAGNNGAMPTEFTDQYTPYSGAIEIDTDIDLHVEYERF